MTFGVTVVSKIVRLFDGNFTLVLRLKVPGEEKFLKVINVSNHDHYVKKITAYNFLQLFIIAQLDESESLSALSNQMKNTNIYEYESISTSQLSRKQRTLSQKPL